MVKLKEALQTHGSKLKKLDNFIELEFGLSVNNYEFLAGIEDLLKTFRDRGYRGSRFHERKYRMAFYLICSNLSYKYLKQKNYISYRRSKDFFSTSKNDNPHKVKLESFLDVIDWMVKEGYVKSIIGDRGYSNSTSRRASRFTDLPKLQQLLNLGAPSLKVHVAPEVSAIVLKAKNERPIPFKETKAIAAMRKQLVRYNELLASKSIAIGGTSLYQEKIYRVFRNESFKKHGRYYGGSWMNCKSDLRPTITINGEPTVELDFSRFHITMLYHLENLEPLSDSYKIPNYPEWLVKDLINRAINCRSEDATIKAMLEEEDDNNKLKLKVKIGKKKYKKRKILKKNGLEIDYNYLKTLMKEVISYHQPVVHKLFKGLGLDLQYIDSKITSGIIDHFLNMNEIVLPVHDSFIVRVSLKDELEKVMIESYYSEVGSRNVKLKVKASIKAGIEDQPHLVSSF